MVSSDCIDSSMDVTVDDTCKPINVESLREGSSDNPLFIELCSGCGILSATIKAVGFMILPIDCDRNKHRLFKSQNYLLGFD